MIPMTRHASVTSAIGTVVAFLALVSLGTSITASGKPILASDHGPVPSKPVNRTPSSAVRALQRSGKMDLNSASCRDLELLPGIGPALASRIVDFRKRNGPFRSVNELVRVRGIGPKTLERVEPMLRLDTKTGRSSK
jgi:competence ComEA-like helix-hairpin-helix protein